MFGCSSLLDNNLDIARGGDNVCHLVLLRITKVPSFPLGDLKKYHDWVYGESPILDHWRLNPRIEDTGSA